MRLLTKRRRRLARLLLAASLCAFCVGCGASSFHPVRCPQPNAVEIDDYAMIVELDPGRPAVRWIGRVIGRCWPDEADEQRAES